MRNDVNGPEGDERLSARLVFVALLGAVLFLPPLLSAANHGAQALGLPVVWLYLFASWILVIVLVALVVRRSG